MAIVTITLAALKSNGQPVLTLSAPFHPECAARARSLGGSWDSAGRKWHFDPRDEERVRALAFDLWGTDGRPDSVADTATIRVTITSEMSEFNRGISIGGRSVAYARGRDGGARLGEGVIVIDGPEPRSGGSVKNWKTIIPAGCVLEIRDIPRAAVERLLAENHPEFTVEIRDEVSTPAEIAATGGMGLAASETELAWAAIQALPIEAQVEIRNRLLATL